MLDELCRSVVDLLSCDAAVVLYNVGAVKRILGSAGVASRYKSYEFDFTQAPYAQAERFEATELNEGDPLSAISHKMGITSCAFFLREPVIADKGITISLIALGARQRGPLDNKERALVNKILPLIRKEVSIKRAQLAAVARHVTVMSSLATLQAEVKAAKQAECLLDSDLRIVAVSELGAKMLGQKPVELLGKQHSEFNVPASEAIAWLYSRALTTHISPPEFEIIHHLKGGERHILRMNVSPLSPTDTTDYFLLVTVNDVSELDDQTTKLNALLAQESMKGVPPKEPSLLFLAETLVQRRAIRERNSVNFLTLRSWRQAIREYQIEALKALKQNLPVHMPLLIAEEMAKEINNLVGAGAFRAIVPMPCSNGNNGTCLSREIARSLGTLLNLPVIMALAAPRNEGSSHPKKNLRRAKMMLVDNVTDPIILVDDVATSGAHIEEAVKLLKPKSGAVFPVVWISGDKA